MNATFTCDHCRRAFEQGRSDEEAQTEFETVFTERERQLYGDDVGVLCDDCWERFLKWLSTQPRER